MRLDPHHRFALGLAGLSLACTPANSGSPAAPVARQSTSFQTVPPAGSAAAHGSDGDGGPKDLASAPGHAQPDKAEPPALPRSTAVLHIGDSFALAGFAQALRVRMKEVGARYEVRSEQSSYTTTWAAKLELLIANTQPDLVIITLGANEVTNVNPPAHAPAVRRIVQLIGGRPCVWVAPPLWRKDTGIMDVIRENSAPCRFFDTDALVKVPIPRQSDKVHPNAEGGAVWADAFWTWLLAERAVGDGRASTVGPWALKSAPPDEHQPRPADAVVRDAHAGAE